PREVPRLCRGGSSSLTIQAVVHRTDSRIVSHHAHEREFDDGRLRKPKPHQMGLQISCGVHSQVPQEDVVCGIEAPSRGGVPQVGLSKGKPHRGRSSDAGPCPHDDLHSTKVRGFAGGWLYQGKERNPSGPGLWGEEAQFCGAALLGQRVLRLDRRSRRSGDPGIHQKAGARGQPPGSTEHVALTATFRWPKESGVALATPTAALSGPRPKAPGSAGGYLPSTQLFLYSVLYPPQNVPQPRFSYQQ